jgi:c(7)-type cytochrome triheme protein
MVEMEQGKSCGVCHDGKGAFSVAGDCQKCHPASKAIKFDFPGKPIGSVTFSHKVHVARSYVCGDCHYKIYPSERVRKPVNMRQMEEGKSCGKCHGFSMAFSVKDSASCNRCHKREQEEL